MATGAPVPELLQHPKPQWWLYHAPIIGFTPVDLCEYCGHIRRLHVNGCTARSTSLMGNPAPCDCTNTATGNLYRDATKLA